MKKRSCVHEKQSSVARLDGQKQGRWSGLLTTLNIN
jgi:hypothetical protein